MAFSYKTFKRRAGTWVNRFAVAFQVAYLAGDRLIESTLEVHQGLFADVMVDAASGFGDIGHVHGHRYAVARTRAGDVIFNRHQDVGVVKAFSFEDGTGRPTVNGQWVLAVHLGFWWGQAQQFLVAQVAGQIVQDACQIGSVRVNVVGQRNLARQCGDTQAVFKPFGFDVGPYAFDPDLEAADRRLTVNGKADVV
jgi:hypothetical protein